MPGYREDPVPALGYGYFSHAHQSMIAVARGVVNPGPSTISSKEISGLLPDSARPLDTHARECRGLCRTCAASDEQDVWGGTSDCHR